ncbi:MAG TPA: hypothetical protein VNH39_04385 [Steroidobacteraceae bacterium]|nr:hypothetical protein [Steroidobacteraceae bacterium]
MSETKFDWSEVIERRIVLADRIARQNKLSLKLHAAVSESFTPPTLLDDQFLADLKMWEVPLYVAAYRMKEAANGRHVIDHAWWLIANDRAGEPWGFVTEPYVEPRYASLLARKMHNRLVRWGIDVWTMPKELSTWSPGSTVPIVTTVREGCLSEFLAYGVGWALKEMQRARNT